MNDTEKRREQLLKSTRKTYDSRYANPPVHPRYQASFSYEEEERETKSSLGTRILFSMLLFLAVALLEQYDHALYLRVTECIMGR